MTNRRKSDRRAEDREFSKTQREQRRLTKRLEDDITRLAHYGLIWKLRCEELEEELRIVKASLLDMQGWPKGSSLLVN